MAEDIPKSPIEIEKIYNDALEPYAKELGLLLHAWNSLHVDLTFLYLAVWNPGYDNADDETNIMLAIWNAIPNDRFQRNMLRQAAKFRFGAAERKMQEIGVMIEPIRDNEAKQLDEIIWILESADTMGRKRDDSAHMPTIMSGDTLRVVPMDWLGHPIAAQMSGKDIVAEFNLSRERLAVISHHTMAMWRYLIGSDAQRSLPQRPAWPKAPQSSERKA